MRTIVALAAIAASLALGGCFYHHSQQAYVSEMPAPPPVTSIK
jgi:hypothetical protein